MNEQHDPPSFSLEDLGKQEDSQAFEYGCSCLLLILVLVLVFLRKEFPTLFAPATPTYTWKTPTPPAIPGPSETPVPIRTLSPEEKIYTTTWQEDIYFQTLAQDRLLRIGSMYLGFEPDTARLSLSITVPPAFINEDLFSFERILLPPARISDLYTTRTNAPGIDGCLLTSNILVYPVMEADVTSPDFVIESFDAGAPQVLDVTQPYSRVLWEWSLSRQYTDEGLVSLWIYLNEIPEPSWSCTFLLDMSR